MVTKLRLPGHVTGWVRCSSPRERPLPGGTAGGRAALLPATGGLPDLPAIAAQAGSGTKPRKSETRSEARAALCQAPARTRGCEALGMTQPLGSGSREGGQCRSPPPPWWPPSGDRLAPRPLSGGPEKCRLRRCSRNPIYHAICPPQGTPYPWSCSLHFLL